MYRVWHVDKYKITFKSIINWTNKILQHTVISSGLSRPGIIDAMARYWAAARWLRNTGLYNCYSIISISSTSTWPFIQDGCLMFFWPCIMNWLYRVSQEECARFRESVPYVELYRYNPKHLYPKLNGYGDNNHRKVWASEVSTYCTPSVTPYSPIAHAWQQDTAS